MLFSFPLVVSKPARPMASLIVTIISSLALLRSTFGETLSTVNTVANGILESRNVLRSGHVELRSTVTIGKGRLAGTARTFHAHVYFAGDRIRGDYDEEYSPLGTAKGHESEKRTGKYSFADGVFRLYSDQKFPGPRPAEVRKLTDSIADLHRVPDPRKIGILPVDTQLYHSFALNEYLSNPQWRFVEDLGEETLRGVVCRKWRFRKVEPGGTETDPKELGLVVWVAPERDNSIMGMFRDAGSYRKRIECDLREVKGFGWFPSFVEFTRWDHDLLSRKETLEVSVHQFNQPISDDFFRFIGMGVPVDSIILDFANSNTGDPVKHQKMTDTGPVDVDFKELYRHEATPLAGTSDSVWRQALLTINGVVVGLLAILILLSRRWV